MAQIFPFAAYRYDPGRVGLEKVLTQPYDKITPDMQERYYAASPYNLIAVEKGKPFADDSPASNVYTRAAQKLEEWIADRILVRDPAPAIYIYLQDYVPPGSTTRRRRQGFIALGRLEDYSKGIVFRHEKTLAAPKADRLELLRRTRTQTGQLFMLYDDANGRIEELLAYASADPAPVELRDEYDVVHRLWPTPDADWVRGIVSAMADRKLIIADGHHRYETALAYRDECRQALGGTEPSSPAEMAMMTFISAQSKGLTILPTHRVIRNLSPFDMEQFRKEAGRYFDWYAYPFASPEERASVYAEFRKDLQRLGHARHAIGVYPGGGAFYLFLLRRSADLEQLLPELSPAQRKLDVALLHRLILENALGITSDAVARETNIAYERETDAAIAAVDKRQAQLACLLNQVRIEQVAEIALAGDVLPQKSTDFYPKLLSGLTIYKMG